MMWEVSISHTKFHPVSLQAAAPNYTNLLCDFRPYIADSLYAVVAAHPSWLLLTFGTCLQSAYSYALIPNLNISLRQSHSLWLGFFPTWWGDGH